MPSDQEQRRPAAPADHPELLPDQPERGQAGPAEREAFHLTLSALNPFAVITAQGSGYDWVSPQWPVDQAFVNDAHAAGLKVVPYTLDNPRDMRAARAVGVDA